MTKAAKLARKLLDGRSDAAFRFDDLCLILARAGFLTRQGKGSHHIFYKGGVEEIINLQSLGNMAKPYQVKQVRELLLKYKIKVS